MSRLAASLGLLWGLCLVPLALTAPTTWFMLPAHLLLALLACIASTVAGLVGRPGLARAWGAGFVLVTLAVVFCLQVGAAATGGAWWEVPWLLLLLWSWPVPVFAGLGAWVGERRLLQRNRRTVRRRRARLSPGA